MVSGRTRVRKLLGNWGKAVERIGAITIERVDVNGQPGARFLAPDGKLINVMALDIADGHIQAIRSIVNPDKLGHLGEPVDLKALLKRR